MKIDGETNAMIHAIKIANYHVLNVKGFIVSEEVKTEEIIELNLKQELFCQYYVKNTETFCNATFSYAYAYDYKLNELSKDRKKIEGTLNYEDSDFEKAEHTCAVNGSDLLRNTDIQKRIRQLFNELLRDDVVDSELSKLIVQDVDWDVKIASIREYNKLKSRITEKIDHTTLGKEIPAPIYGGQSKDLSD